MKKRTEEEKELNGTPVEETSGEVSDSKLPKKAVTGAAAAAAFFAKLGAGIKHYASLIILIVFVGAIALVSNLVAINNGSSPLLDKMPMAEASFETGGSAIENATALNQFLRSNTAVTDATFNASSYAAGSTAATGGGIPGLADANVDHISVNIPGDDGKYYAAHTTDFIYSDGGTMTYAFWACCGNTSAHTNLMVWYSSKNENSVTAKWANYIKVNCRAQNGTIKVWIYAVDESGGVVNIKGSSSSYSSISTSFTDYGKSVPLRKYQYVAIRAYSTDGAAAGNGRWLLLTKIEPTYYHDRSHYLTTNITLNTSGNTAKNNNDVTNLSFSKTFYGNGKKITWSTCKYSSAHTTENVDGNEGHYGVLFGTLTGKVKDLTLVINVSQYNYSYSSGGNKYVNFIGGICGMLNGGSLYNVTVQSNSGKGISYKGKMTGSGSGAAGGGVALVCAKVGDDGGTVRNTKIIHNGCIFANGHDKKDKSGSNASNRAHVGALFAETVGSPDVDTLIFEGSGVICCDNDGTGDEDEAGGLIGVVRSGSSFTMYSVLYKFNGSIGTYHNNPGVIIGWCEGTCTIKSLCIRDDIRPKRYKNCGADDTMSLPSGATAYATHDEATALSQSECSGSSNKATVTGTWHYNQYLYSVAGSSYSSDYGTFEVSPYWTQDEESETVRDTWRVTMTPTSSYIAASIKSGSNGSESNFYTQLFDTYYAAGTQRTYDYNWNHYGCSDAHNYVGYAAKISTTLSCASGGNSGQYDGAGWTFKPYYSIDSKTLYTNTGGKTINGSSISFYYHSQNASGGNITTEAADGTSKNSVLTHKDVGVYTCALRTGTGANATLFGTSSSYRVAYAGDASGNFNANTPSYVGYYDGDTITFTTTKRELEFVAKTTGGSYTYNGQQNWENRAVGWVKNIVHKEVLKFYFYESSPRADGKLVYF
ncbi:MAG: hypothetical protein IJU10_04065, partial [Clostridia bacterium]|nr:hypothetical protein [Clostridia bacterium]